MIPRAHVVAWSREAPWGDPVLVEHDLVLGRAIVELFRRPAIGSGLLLRGGTALHKLYCPPPPRFSEDIDLVQAHPGPIGPLVDEIRAALDPWLGRSRWKQGPGRFTIRYRIPASSPPPDEFRLKIEINTREHLTVLGPVSRGFSVQNPWFSGSANVATYRLEELLGTKLRALFQRRAGRDLFDLWYVLSSRNDLDLDAVVECFLRYTEFIGEKITRARFEENMLAKMGDRSFREDILPLLRPDIEYNAEVAWEFVHESMVSRLPGDPFRGLGES